MKKITTFAKAVMTIILFIAATRESAAATFTAVASGNWTSSATWGLSAPGVNITNADIIVIPPGITVTLDEDVTINNSLASLAVIGTLNGSYALTINSGELTQSGTISVNSLSIGSSGYLTSTGTVTVTDFTNQQTLLSLAADVAVSRSLTLSAGTIQLNTGSTIQLANNATINIAGGTMTMNGGVVNIGGTYNLTYYGSATAIGIEASLPGLQDVMVNLASPSASVQLQGNLTVNGQLNLQQGNLVLNGYNLTLNGSVSTSTNSCISSTSSSNITISGAGAMGIIGFSATGNTIGNLSVNISGTGGSVSLGSGVIVAGDLNLQSGTFSLNGYDITLNGAINVSGTGCMGGNLNSDITITGVGNIGTLQFSAGSSIVGSLTVDINGMGGSVSLGSDVTVNSTLTVSSGTLMLNGFNLTTNGTINISNSASIGGNTNSAITINGSGSIGTIVLAPAASTLQSLTINIGGNGSVSLGSDITVAGQLALQSGTLILNSNDLTLSGTINASGSGTISSNSNSNIVINGSGYVGTIEFISGGTTVGNLTINLYGSGGSVSLGSDLNISGNLILSSGNINLGDYDLTIQTGGSIQGGSASAYINASGSGSLIMAVSAGGGNTTFQVGTSTEFAPIVITNNSSTGGNFMVHTNAGVFAGGTTGVDLSATESVVNVSWEVETDITANVNADLEVFWSADMEVNAFNRTQAYLSHYANSAWDASAFMQATVHTNGTFSVKRTGISAFSPFAVFDNNTATGIDDLAKTPLLGIFPNPASTVMNVSIPEVGNNYRIKVYDGSGRVIAENLITSTTTSFDISEWEQGVYFVSVNNGSARTFVKQ